jgi:hypothetical protein
MAIRRRNFNAPKKAKGACSTWFGGCAGTGSQSECNKKCAGQAAVRKRTFRGQAGTRQGGQARGRVTGKPTTFLRRAKNRTGQPVTWKNAGGEIFGLTTQQALIAVGIGVAAYFIIQKGK